MGINMDWTAHKKSEKYKQAQRNKILFQTRRKTTLDRIQKKYQIT